MRECLFCDNPANTREHLWPDWVLKSLDIKEASLRKIGTGPKTRQQASEPEVCTLRNLDSLISKANS